MSEGLNRVMLLGNLAADGEVRYAQNGQAILKLRLATNESYLDKDKQRRERTDFHNVVVFGKRGEGLSKILQKGDSIFVEGSLRTSSYDKEGQKVYRTEVIAANIILAGGKRGQSPDGEPADRGYGQSAPRQRRQDPPAQEPPPDDYEQGGGFGSDDTIPF